jgi:antimicrobial peptide system SdpB family protein
MTGLVRAAARCEPRGTPLAIARTGLALAHLSILVFTPEDSLFFPLPRLPDGARCDGPRMLALWCVAGPAPAAREAARILSIMVLLVIASGYRPRWTCIPHWYLTYSLGVSMTLPNGGEQAAQILTMLLIPVCLGDKRTWQWTVPSTPQDASWRGASFAALLTIRTQSSIIYGSAAISKLAVPQWRDGTALYSVAIDPNFGFPIQLDHTEPTAASTLLLTAATWSVIGLEISIAVLMLGHRRMRIVGLAMGIILHGAIIFLMGLFSFGVIMIALLAAAYTGGSTRRNHRPDIAAATPSPQEAETQHRSIRTLL